MSAPVVIFYLLSAIILGGAIIAVTGRRIFRAAVFLLFSLTGIAGVYFFLEYEFLAAVQIVVYVGGIVVLIIFSIFLTGQSGSNLPQPKLPRKLVAALASVVAAALIMWLALGHTFTAEAGEITEPTTANIGRQMLSTGQHGYILPFEVVSVLLLAAMISCIVIAIKIKRQHE
jgi:NADH-quinone oxidoreductase subunit J